MEGEKRCSRCKEIKPITDFYKSEARSKRLSKAVYFSDCILCNKKRTNNRPLKDYQKFTPIENEIWKPVVGFDGLYEISSLGRLLSLCSRPKIKKVFLSDRGYYRTDLSKNGIQSNHFIHILVATAFIPNPENKPTVNHKKGIKTDNRASELEWATEREQMQHAHMLGLCKVPKGEKAYNSSLTNEQALIIFNSKLPICTLAKLYNISGKIISNIKRGYTYSSVTGKKYAREGRLKKYNKETILAIFNSINSHKEISIQYKAPLVTISAIKTGRLYSSITGKYYRDIH